MFENSHNIIIAPLDQAPFSIFQPVIRVCSLPIFLPPFCLKSLMCILFVFSKLTENTRAQDLRHVRPGIGGGGGGIPPPVRLAVVRDLQGGRSESVE